MLVRLWSNWEPCIVGRNVKSGSHHGKQFGSTSRRLTIWPSNCAPSYVPQRTENISLHTKTGEQMFLETLFTTAKKWKQPKRPPTDEHIHKRQWDPHRLQPTGAGCQAPLSMELARQEHWSGKPFLSPRKSNFWPRDQTWVSHTEGSVFTIWATREAPVRSTQQSMLFIYKNEGNTNTCYSKDKTWNIMLSERSQTEKDKYYYSTYMSAHNR